MDRHVFLALPLTEQAKDELLTISDSIKDSVNMKKWVHPQDYHLTLVFLGNADDRALERLSEMLTERTLAEPFVLEIEHLGSFGRPHQPRILWAGIKENDELEKLQSQIAAMCSACGFELEKRRFSPHITLARSYQPEAKPLSMTVEELWPESGKVITVKADTFVLFETMVGNNPKYRIRETYHLNKQ